MSVRDVWFLLTFLIFNISLVILYGETSSTETQAASLTPVVQVESLDFFQE